MFWIFQIKSPLAKPDEEKDLLNVAVPHEEAKKFDNFQIENIDGKNQANMNLPLPYMNRQASSASNNAAEKLNRPEDQPGVLPAPVQPGPSDEKYEPNYTQNFWESPSLTQ